MKTCRVCSEQKELELFKKHSGCLDGRAKICKACDSKRAVENQRKNWEHRKAYIKGWLEQNPEAAKRYDANRGKWAKEHPEKRKEYKARHLAKPGVHEKALEYSREYCRKNSELKTQKKLAWMKKYPERVREAGRRRQAKKLNATPVWADTNAIKLVYKKAQEFRERFGGDWEVDHVVPLISPLVCGLHVEANLQILIRTENLSKGNRNWPEMP